MPQKKRRYWLGHPEPSEQDRFFLDALDDELWEAGDSEDWDTCWYTGMPDSDVFEELDANKSINHIAGNNALTIKSHLYNTLLAARQRLAGTDDEARYGFFPETFSMPEDYQRFLKCAQTEPEQLWIKKPRNLSRGRGIDMVRHPASIPLDDEWIIQRYLGNPHLCQGRKYVLRCYVLITSIEPLRFYWYQDGFAKLASEAYSSDDLHNLYRHLTNPDINEKNESAEAAVTFISFKKYGQWLESQGHNQDVFFTQLKELITLTVIAARESFRKRSDDIDADTQGCYELIGLDCMVDSDIRPWIIECNLSPSLSTYADPEAGADDEVTAKRTMVNDMVNLLGLNTSDYTKTLSPTEKAEQEYLHRGQIERLFPSADSNKHLRLFPIPRYSDIDHVEVLAGITADESLLHLHIPEDSDYAFEDSLSLLARNSQGQADCIAPNELASWIWLNINNGLSPSDIITQLCQTLPAQAQTAEQHKQVSQQVWNVLADWGQAHIFSHLSREPSPKNEDFLTSQQSKDFLLIVAGQEFHIHCFCPTAAHYLSQHEQLTPLSNINKPLLSIDIIAESYGYSLIYQRHKSLNGVKLAQLLPELYQLASKAVTAKHQALLLPGSLIQHKQQNTLVICEEPQLLEGISHTLCQEVDYQLTGHKILLNQKGNITPLDIPARLPIEKSISVWKVLEDDSEHLFYYQTPEFSGNRDNNTIEHIVLIGINKEGKTAATNRAQLLAKLWQLIPSTQHKHAQQLAYWIEQINHISFLNEDDSYTKEQWVQQLKNVLGNIEDHKPLTSTQ